MEPRPGSAEPRPLVGTEAHTEEVHAHNHLKDQTDAGGGQEGPEGARGPGLALTCVCIPLGHQDTDPAPQEEADLLCTEHLPDGRESLRAEGE